MTRSDLLESSSDRPSFGTGLGLDDNGLGPSQPMKLHRPSMEAALIQGDSGFEDGWMFFVSLKRFLPFIHPREPTVGCKSNTIQSISFIGLIFMNSMALYYNIL